MSEKIDFNYLGQQLPGLKKTHKALLKIIATRSPHTISRAVIFDSSQALADFILFIEQNKK